ncbi:hypothetical protein L1887_47717 [Cichorium endivia]|nr:hypothetical protein L1887_47717 [Cichorium endivia]
MPRPQLAHWIPFHRLIASVELGRSPVTRSACSAAHPTLDDNRFELLSKVDGTHHEQCWHSHEVETFFSRNIRTLWSCEEAAERKIQGQEEERRRKRIRCGGWTSSTSGRQR